MQRHLYPTLLVLFSAPILMVCHPTTKAQLSKGLHFSSPSEAADELIKAAANDDQERLIAILGPESKDLISSGDPVADRKARERVVGASREKVAIEPTAPNATRVTLILGDGNWPFPIPLVKDKQGWRFDTEAGRVEILARRIGRNEADAMDTLNVLRAAEFDYAAADRTGDGVLAYATKFVSSPGKRDGLYWKDVNQGEEPSPLSEAVAKAMAEGYTFKRQQPFHGYYFKILTAQGSNASGGAHSYVAGDSMIGGFAIVAWPAQYGSTGIMTFLTSYDGSVYQKDLGPNTDTAAQAMTAFDPDNSWEPVT